MKTHLRWQAPEYQYYQKSGFWFIITGLFAIGLFLWALFTKNFLFALLVGLGYFSIAVFAAKKPKTIKIALTSNGIKIGRVNYSFENLKSFWIFYKKNGPKELSVRSKKSVMPYLKIPLGDENPAKVRKILIKYLPEKKQEESAIDSLARGFRF